MTAKLVRQGKVRDIYDLGDSLLLVASDRISAFDWVLPDAIPDKGRVLTQISAFWLDRLDVPNHLISTEVDSIEPPAGVERDWLAGRSMIVKKCEVAPVECVVRGYLAGSGWKDYKKTRVVSGVSLPEGMVESQQFDEPIFTPSTKADEGHDEPISYEQVVELVGDETARELRDRSLDVYRRGAAYARERGIIIADTKFEWGFHNGRLLLIDEVLTPDSSRFWPADDYEPGRGQASFDKQFVRDYLETTGWDKSSEPPSLPADIVSRTRDKYIDAFERITGEEFRWK